MSPSVFSSSSAVAAAALAPPDALVAPRPLGPWETRTAGRVVARVAVQAASWHTRSVGAVARVKPMSEREKLPSTR